jgi:hypothetical protein
MTVEKVDSFKVTSKRKEHPNARKYPGHPSMEFGSSLTKFIFDLEEQEQKEFLDGTLVFEEEVSAAFYDSIQEGDVIGLGLTKGYERFETKGPAAYKFEVIKVFAGKDRMRVKNVSFEGVRGYTHTLKEIDLCFEEVSWSFGAGFGEILQRNDKPFGVPEEMEYTVNIYGDTDVSGSVSGSADAPPQLTTGDASNIEEQAETEATCATESESSVTDLSAKQSKQDSPSTRSK